MLVKMVIRRGERRIDLGWVPKGSDPMWITAGTQSMEGRRVRIARRNPVMEGAEDETAIRAYGVLYFFGAPG